MGVVRFVPGPEPFGLKQVLIYRIEAADTLNPQRTPHRRMSLGWRVYIVRMGSGSKGYKALTGSWSCRLLFDIQKMAGYTNIRNGHLYTRRPFSFCFCGRVSSL